MSGTRGCSTVSRSIMRRFSVTRNTYGTKSSITLPLANDMPTLTLARKISVKSSRRSNKGHDVLKIDQGFSHGRVTKILKNPGAVHVHAMSEAPPGHLSRGIINRSLAKSFCSCRLLETQTKLSQGNPRGSIRQLYFDVPARKSASVFLHCHT